MQNVFFKKNTTIILFILTLGLVYLYTISPTLTPEDSGEIATASFSLGIAHPPGYPLYIIASKLFTFIPVKSVIFRTNLFSLFFGIFTCLILIKIIYILTSNFYLGLISATLFGFSKTFWSQSIITEVYTFNLFLVSIFILYSIKTIKNAKYVKFNFFLSGILVVSHYSNFLVLLPVWLILFLKYKNQLLKLINFLWALFPLTLFFILIIRSKSNPLIDWGNPENLHNFIIHILRLSFGSMISMSSRNIYSLYQQFKMFIKMCSMQLGFVAGLIILLFGLWGIKKSPKNFKTLFILLLLFTSIGTILVLNFKIDEESYYINQVFFLQFYFILIIVSSIGFANLNQKSISLLLIITIFTFLKNFKYNNRSDYNFTIQYNRNILKSATFNSTIFVAKDFATFPLLYLSKVEYIRPDIKFYDWFGNVFEKIFKREDFHLLPDFKRDALREKITDKIRLTNKNETYYTFQRGTLSETKCLGLIYTFNKKHPDFDIVYYEFPSVTESKIKYLDYFVKNMISVYYFHIGYYYKQKGNEKKAEELFEISNKFGGNKGKHLVNLAVNEMKVKNLTQAINYLKEAISIDSTLDKAYFYLGNIYFQQQDYNQAKQMYIECIKINKFNGPAYNNLGNLYLKLGNIAKAKTIFKQGLFTGYSKLFNNLSLLLAKEGNYQSAEFYLKQGIKVSPEDVNLYLNLSVILSRQNKWTEAGKWLEKAIKIAPGNRNVLLNLALVYIKLNRLNNAKVLLEQGSRKFPEDTRFKYYLNLIK